MITLDLTIFSSSTATDVVVACDSYTWIDGKTYTSSNNTATIVRTSIRYFPKQNFTTKSIEP